MRFLALGDSYTIGEGVAGSERWPLRVVDAWRARGEAWDDPTYVATTGWTTGELAEGIRGTHLSPPYDRVSLSIGVNNQYQGLGVDAYREEFGALLSTALDLAGGDPRRVIVVSIPDYGLSPFAKGRDPARIARELDAFNAAAASVCAARGVRFVDVTGVSRQVQEGWWAADGLHPSGRQYAAWAQAIAGAVR